jgi:radical SAM superfamily enzyme YgiQ (UPF0313 family)
MAEAGCHAICFGVESGNQEMLDLVKKHSSLAKVREAMRMTQEAGISTLASFIIGLPGETEETLRETVAFAESLRQEFGSLFGFHVLAPFPGTEARERAEHYGLEILTSNWEQYDANHVVSRTRGADVGALQTVADAYEDSIARYRTYQDYLYAQGRLEGYELRSYLRRRRQSLLWKLLLDDAVDTFAPFRSSDPQSELERAVADHTGADSTVVAEEMRRVVELGALTPRPGPDGVRFAWTD